jgi:DNA-binding winged helix-turn-helix (wHTH) protein/Tfp pilus assembly protein PilF
LRYLFENCVLDTDRCELRRGEKVVHTTRQVFDLLAYLIEHRDRVLTKDDLFNAIWCGRIVSELALTTRLNAARHALADDGKAQRLIRTFARKGYRFVGDVRVETRDLPQAVSAESARCVRIASPSELPSVAVPPFTIMDRSLTRVARWQVISGDLRAELTGRRWLRVLLTLPEDPGEPAQYIGQASRSGARYVLIGGLRRAEGGVQITIDLVEVATRVQLWSGRYEASGNGSTRSDDDLIARVASTTSAVILRREQQRSACKEPHQLEAWEAYHLGMLHMSRCEAGENQIARAFFRRSTEIDPDYAPGYSAMAWSYMMSASIFSEMPIGEGCQLGDALTLKALDTDEEDAEAHARFALSDLLRGDLEDAVKRAEQVLKANPSCADALGVKGAALIYSSRREDGRVALRKYLSLRPRDPARPIRLSQIATSHYLDGDYAAAAAVAADVVRRYPSHPTAFRWLAASLGKLGNIDGARDALRGLRKLSPASFEMYVRNRPKFCSIEHAPMLDGLRMAGLRV